MGDTTVGRIVKETASKTVKCAFGILHSKWRIISKAIETEVEQADNFRDPFALYVEEYTLRYNLKK